MLDFACPADACYNESQELDKPTGSALVTDYSPSHLHRECAKRIVRARGYNTGVARMSGPIVRSGPSPQFTQNWDSVFGKSAGAKKSSAKAEPAKAEKKKSAKKKKGKK